VSWDREFSDFGWDEFNTSIFKGAAMLFANVHCLGGSGVTRWQK
jgi:hypothetical protein